MIQPVSLLPVLTGGSFIIKGLNQLLARKSVDISQNVSKAIS